MLDVLTAENQQLRSNGDLLSASPSLLQGELHFLPKPLFLRKRGCNRTLLACSEPLRSKVVGPSEVSPYFAGWDRLDEGSL